MSSAIGADRKTLRVRVLEPEEPVFEGEALMVIAPSVQGEVGILPRHTPFIAFLKPGATRIKLPDDTELVLATSLGYISVEDSQVLLLVEQVERADEIDVERAQAALERADATIAAGGDDEVVLAAAQAAKRRAENRLQVAARGA